MGRRGGFDRVVRQSLAFAGRWEGKLRRAKLYVEFVRNRARDSRVRILVRDVSCVALMTFSLRWTVQVVRRTTKPSTTLAGEERLSASYPPSCRTVLLARPSRNILVAAPNQDVDHHVLLWVTSFRRLARHNIPPDFTRSWEGLE